MQKSSLNPGAFFEARVGFGIGNGVGIPTEETGTNVSGRGREFRNLKSEIRNGWVGGYATFASAFFLVFLLSGFGDGVESAAFVAVSVSFSVGRVPFPFPLPLP